MKATLQSHAENIRETLPRLDPHSRQQLLETTTPELLTTTLNSEHITLVHWLGSHGYLNELPLRLQTHQLLADTRDEAQWSPIHFAALSGFWYTLPPQFKAEPYLTGHTESHGWSVLHLLAVNNAPTVQQALKSTKG